ncbi:hypothetical protein VPHG_00034 [Vibrio phage 11895-B1]|uniref:hypothetical protein n=1 Tax=Vibrio phage 11895-B1 TaxID=754075 RepID=UPI0002C0E1F6|nr:hypothetical protein VPHG_00034 [Vibrio phage 11895-B1]AGH32101.1 hypothetical protein VPHG_00034 [Vibrio phage 11895-B1]
METIKDIFDSRYTVTIGKKGKVTVKSNVSTEGMIKAHYQITINDYSEKRVNDYYSKTSHFKRLLTKHKPCQLFKN